jgi:hypothetical protein
MTGNQTSEGMNTIAELLAKERAEARLMEIAFKFQTALLDFVHDGGDPLKRLYTPKAAEALADEIQSLSYYFQSGNRPESPEND